MACVRSIGASAAAVVLLLAGCAAVLEEAQRGAAPEIAATTPIDLIPLWALNGVRLAPAVNRLGAPQLPAAGGLLPFVRPVAVGARDTDLFVVDSGRNALLRIDPFTQTATVVPTDRAVLGGPVQLAVRADRSLLLIDGARQVHWLAADGRTLPSLAAPAPELGQAVDVVDDDARARVWVADGLYRQVLEFAPAARAWRVVTLHDSREPALSSLAALATDARGLYLADPACRCIVLIHPSGRTLGRFGSGDLTQPVALAAGQGRLFVADAGTRELRIFVNGKPTQRFAYRSLGVAEITDLTIDSGTLYVAAGLDARVLALRIVARTGGAPQ